MPNEPLDHYISQPPPDAVADVHGELDSLARVAVAAGDALTRTLAQRGAREAKALAAAATARMPPHQPVPIMPRLICFISACLSLNLPWNFKAGELGESRREGA